MESDRYMKSVRDLAGQRFGRLTVIREHGRDKDARAMWYCACDCGVIKPIASRCLLYGTTYSCGCLRRERAVARNTTHASFGSPTHYSWQAMRIRCRNPRSKDYHRYGGRGIVICDRWDKFENFLADMGERPVGKTLDRRDNDGNYEPSNCKWSTRKEQAANRCTSRHRNEERQTL